MREHIDAGPGLSLRPWSAADAAVVAGAFAEPGMERQADEPVDSRGAAERWVQRRAAQWADGAAYALAVVAADGAVLGDVTVGAVNRRHGTGWVSYWTLPAARGTGVATRACAALAAWAFRDLELFRLELGHRVNNPASCRVAHGAGFAVEGLQRQKLHYDGVRHDVELHARLASDPWPGVAG